MHVPIADWLVWYTTQLQNCDLVSWKAGTITPSKSAHVFHTCQLGSIQFKVMLCRTSIFSHTPKVAAVQLIAHNQTELETMVKTTFMQLDAAI